MSTTDHDNNSDLLVGIQDTLRTVINHVKYGWAVEIKPSFNLDSIVYFLGRRYMESKSEIIDKSIRSLEEFSDDFSSCLYFTYRCDFEPITRAALLKSNNCFLKISSNNIYNDCSLSYDETDADLLLVNCIEMSDSQTSRVKPFSYSSSVPTRETLISPCELQDKELRSSSQFDSINIQKEYIDVLRTSDCGWGCMLRSAQMLLGQCIVRHIFGDSYLSYHQGKFILTGEEEIKYRDTITMFNDTFNSPFSIHKFILLSGKEPGTWYGPTTAANLLVNSLISAKCEGYKWIENFEIYIANDRVVVKEQITSLLKRNYTKANELDAKHFYSVKHSGQLPCDCIIKESNKSDQTSLLLLIPMKLGCGQKIDMKNYGESLKQLMADPCFCGVLGGKPKRSVFISGYQDNKYIYFEPHIKQKFVNTTKPDFPLKSFSCFVPRLGRFEHLDSSVTIGFFCRSLAEMKTLFGRLNQIKPRIFELVSISDRSIFKRESTVSIITENIPL